MKQVLQHVRTRKLEVADVPAPGCRPGGVLVRNAASLISAGTERMVTDFASKSLLGKARERPDLVRQVIQKVQRDGFLPTAQAVMSRLDTPIPLGYSCAGTVVESGAGAEELSVGDRVACAGMGYASHADLVYVPKNLAVRIPEVVSFEDASYVTLGAIALQGVRIADVRLGDSVVVIGLGLLGQLAVQLLKAGGCRVFGVDLDPAKVALARELGADDGRARSDDVEGAVRTFTGGNGADAVLIAAAADSNDPTELAGAIARDRASVTIIGAVRMDIPRKVYYEKELQLRLSRSYGPGRYDPEYEEKGRDYPIGYVRWTERRNMEEFLRLVAAGSVVPSRLTTHRFPISSATDAYALISGDTAEKFSGVVLTYPDALDRVSARTISLASQPRRSGRVGVGFIGAGNFARTILLPRFARESAVELTSLVTATGATAKATGEKFGFRSIGTDSSALLADASVSAVVIATRHGSHARLAARALRAGKAVFVEKPLALNDEGLEEVLAAQAESGMPLLVGFNRRFSALAIELRAAFTGSGPLAIAYRVNAGAIPRTSWVHDAEDGGGRIIGEACHFIDVIQFLTDARVSTVYAAKLGGAGGATLDTVSITLSMSDGSVATLAYYATGDKSFSKERVEVFGTGAVGVIEDWRVLNITRAGSRKSRKLLSQDKGFDAEISAFVDTIRGQREQPISTSDLASTTRATFAVVESLRSGLPVTIAVEGA